MDKTTPKNELGPKMARKTPPSDFDVELAKELLMDCANAVICPGNSDVPDVPKWIFGKYPDVFFAALYDEKLSTRLFLENLPYVYLTAFDEKHSAELFPEKDMRRRSTEDTIASVVRKYRQELRLRVVRTVSEAALCLRLAWESDPAFGVPSEHLRELYFAGARCAYADGKKLLIRTSADLRLLLDADLSAGVPAVIWNAPPGPAVATVSGSIGIGRRMCIISAELDHSCFNDAVNYVQFHLSHKMRKCPNPECAKPYFFARRKEITCGNPGCVKFAQRKYKKQWHAAKNRGKRMAAA
jgi:hypothetical protein